MDATQKDRIAYAIDRASNAFAVDTLLVMALIQAESGFTANALSNQNCKGLMQVLPSTARKLLQKLGLSPKINWVDIDYNILLGVYLLSLLQKEFRTDKHIIMAYNAGPSRLHSYLEQKHIPSSVSAYANKVLRYKKMLQSHLAIFYYPQLACMNYLCY